MMDELHLERFFAGTEGASVIRRDRRKTLLRVSPGVNDRGDDRDDISREMFVKIFHFHGLAQRMRNSLGKSAGARELEANHRLAALGIAVPGAVGSSDERGGLGLVKNSLYAARWISHMTSIRDLVIKRRREGTLSREWLESLGRAAGGFTAGLHKKGVAPHDMNPGNLLVDERADGTFRLMFLDYEGIRFYNSTPPRVLCRKNLAHLGAFLVQKHESASDAMCRAYAMELDLTGEDMDAFIKDMRKRSLELAAAWKKNLDHRFDMIQQDLEPGDTGN